MPRFEVTIIMEQRHHLFIEADTPYEAQAQALTSLDGRSPERADVQINVERGVR